MATKWIAAGVVLLLALVAYGAYCEGRRAETVNALSLVQAAEAKRLIAEGYIVEQQKTADELRGLADSQATRIADLEAREPGVRIVEVIKGGTEIVTVPPASTPSPPSSSDCSWWRDNCVCPGDECRLTTTIAGFKTIAGNRVLLGESSMDVRRDGVWKNFLPPREWSSDTQWFVAEAPENRPPPRGWGVVGLVGVLDGALAYGAGVETPGVVLLGVRVSPAVYAVTGERASGLLVAGRISW